jgi:hypothetical protein
MYQIVKIQKLFYENVKFRNEQIINQISIEYIYIYVCI